MEAEQIAVVAVLLGAFSLVSRRIETLPITMPMIFVALGAVTDQVGLVDIGAGEETVALFAEMTLAIILFSDAVRVDVWRLRTYLAIPARLLVIGLPLTIALGALTNSLLFPDFPLSQVALLAAVLAPTDAALGTAVVEDEAVPLRDRLALNVESGVNDGLVVPVVAILTAAVIGENQSAGSWARFIGEQIGFGVALGLVLGVVAILSLRWANERGWSDGRYEQLATFGVPIIALFGAEAIDGNSFIAAFVAGLTFGSYGRDRVHVDEAGNPLAPPATYFAEFTEDAAQLFAVVAFFVFGNVFVGEMFSDLTPVIVACALLTLTVGRIVPVWISLIGSGLKPPSRLFLGWFGPRGLASIVFGLLLIEDLETLETIGEDMFSVIAFTVSASVVLHGASASWGARTYGRWAAEAEMSIDERGEMEMVDVDEEMVPRTRWS